MSVTHDVESHAKLPRYHHVRDSSGDYISGRLESRFDKDFRKRKHDDLDNESRIVEPIAIHVQYAESFMSMFADSLCQAHPSSPASKPQRLIPIFLLLRSCLPLTYIDSFDDGEGSAYSKMFSAHIKILEHNAEHHQHLHPKVLIVEDDAHTRLYAIERAQIGVYALSRFFQWVSISILEKLQDTTLACGPPLKREHRDQASNLDGEWWRDAAARPGPGGQVTQQNVLPAPARIREIQLSLKRPFQKNPPSPIFRPILRTNPTEQSECMPDVRINDLPQDPEELFKLVKLQYQEALYVSKVGNASRHI